MTLRSFISDTAGNVAMMTAISAVALFGAGGAAVDYVRLGNERTTLEAAADAASLAAMAIIRDNPDWTPAKLKAAAKGEAQRMWSANVSAEQLKSVGVPTVEVTEISGDWSIRVAFNGEVKTSLLAALGISGLPVAGESVASAGVSESHWQFNFAIDTSSSMGIGATQVDMDAMQADPAINCMFACHFSTTNDDTVAKARLGGYKLRLDVVDDAVDSTIDVITAKTSIKSKAALYGLTTKIDTLVPETASLSTVKDHLIDIAYIGYSTGNTNYRKTLEELTDKVGESGDGSSASKARKVVFIVTDGIHDTNVWESNVHTVVGSDHQVGTIDPAFCEPMKSKGVIVGVLYIDYIIPTGFGGYVDPYKDQILPSLQACASDGYFHNAKSNSEIQSAMKDILSKAFTSEVRLTR